MPLVSSFDGVEIFYETLGDGEITLVFIGGWCAPTAMSVWRHQFSFASQFRLVFLDLAGHGKSGKNREIYTMQSFAQDVRFVVEKMDLRNIILLGHSMGGPVMLETAKLLSERTIGLIAIDSLFPFPHGGYLGMPEDAISEIMKPIEDDFVGFVSGIFGSFINDKFDPEDIKLLEQTPKSLDRRSMLSAYTELLRWDLHNAHSEIEKPIKCIVAGRTCPVENRDEYNKLFDTVYLENLGHLLIIEDPNRFNEALIECVNELQDGSQ